MTDTTTIAISTDFESWIESSVGPFLRIDRLPGDLSPRRYARVHLGRDAHPASLIAALYPAERLDDLDRFAGATALLEKVGVRVPRIYATQRDQGWMLIEDFGERTLAEREDLSDEERFACFEDAAAQGRRIAALAGAEVEALGSERLGEALLARELEQSRRLFLEPRGFLADAGFARDLDRALERLCTNIGEEPAVPCHRDYMARNLVPLAELQGRVGVIDHQDLRLGPPHYDLASLLNDSLFLSRDREERILDAALGSLAPRVSFHRAAAQRTLKAVGTYEKFVRAGGARHQRLIEPTFERFLEHFARIPEGEGLIEPLAQRWGKSRPFC